MFNKKLEKRIEELERRVQELEKENKIVINTYGEYLHIFWNRVPTASLKDVVKQILEHLGLEIAHESAQEEKTFLKPVPKQKRR